MFRPFLLMIPRKLLCLEKAIDEMANGQRSHGQGKVECDARDAHECL